MFCHGTVSNHMLLLIAFEISNLLIFAKNSSKVRIESSKMKIFGVIEILVLNEARSTRELNPECKDIKCKCLVDCVNLASRLS